MTYNCVLGFKWDDSTLSVKRGDSLLYVKWSD